MSKQKPAHEIRLGRIKAIVWANDTEHGLRHNVQVRRLYKDGDDWRETSSLSRDDLPNAAKVLDMAHTWIFENA